MSTLALERTQRRDPAWPKRSSWPRALLWGLSGLSLPVAGFLANQVVGSVDGAASGAVGGALAGTVLGAAQWLVLRRRIQHAHWWIAATPLGFATGLAAGTAIVDAGTGIEDLVISGAVTGGAIGAAQFLVLRSSSKIALLWIPVMAATWPIGWFVTWAGRIDVDEGWTNFGAYGVVAFGVLTAIALFVVPGILARQNSPLSHGGKLTRERTT